MSRLLSYVTSLAPVTLLAACGGTLRGATGDIKSPYFPLAYPGRHECVYNIVQPTGTPIILSFVTFEVGQDRECSTNYLQVHLSYKLPPSTPVIKTTCRYTCHTNYLQVHLSLKLPPGTPVLQNYLQVYLSYKLPPGTPIL